MHLLTQVLFAAKLYYGLHDMQVYELLHLIHPTFIFQFIEISALKKNYLATLTAL